MPESQDQERNLDRPTKKRSAMAEHAARQRGSGVMISPSSVITGIIFLLLFALACGLQVGELKRANKSALQGEDDHHGEEADPGDGAEEAAKQPVKPRAETTVEVRAARTREADEGMASFDMAQVRGWAQLPGSELTPDQSAAIRAVKAFDGLKDADVNVRLDASFELIGATRYWHLLLAALDDEQPETRRIAANCLGLAPWPASAEKLEALGSSDPDPLVREAAILALGMGPAQTRSIPVLEAALSDGNAYIEQAAATSLADMAALEIAEVRGSLVLAAGHSDPAVRGQALTGLYHLVERGLGGGDDLEAALVAALDDHQSDIARQFAVRALSVLGRTDLAERFLALADDEREPGWEIRFHATRTMGNWFTGAAQQQPKIVDALRHISVEDPDQAVQFAAIASLKEMGFDPGKWESNEARS